MPSFRNRPALTDELWNRWSDDQARVQFQTLPINPKLTTAFYLGDSIPQPPLHAPTLLVTTDNIPGDFSSTATLVVNDPHTISTIDTIGDQDFYQVTLVGGHQYEIGMYGYSGGPNAVPLSDSYIEIYDSAHNLIVSADGGANTTANQINSGFDVLLTWTPDVSGTYYINARAFDQDPTNNAVAGGPGDSVGDYEIFVRDPLPGAYQPYYSPDSPLYAIDWGTRVNKVNQTAANPDGDEGPRPTGNAQGTPTSGAGLDINQILADNHKTLADIAGKNVITIYFAHAGEIITSIEDPTRPGLPPAAVETTDVSDFEHNAVMTALHEFEKVADVVYLEVKDKSQADFEYASYKGTPGPGISLLGSMEPPDEPNEGLALFNSGDYRWNAVDLQQGGFSFTTLIHEIGHGNGLAHPHDNGGHSGVMHGVQGTVDTPAGEVPDPTGVWPNYTLGDYDLNQAVYTMMSYEDGWQDSPYGNAPTTGGYGYLGSLMAFDIAAIQDKYGVNEDWATGNDVYTLQDVNAPGTYYRSIWDAGGIDTIVYSGARDANIDLRPATLKYENGGGGWVSYAMGIYGGFTIANGVVIENATSGSGNDHLIGNAANNVLDGGAGNDFFDLSGGGDDHAIGGSGDDGFLFGAAFTPADRVEGGDGSNDQIGLQGDYTGANALVLGANTMTGVEALVVLPGFSYDITTNDGNVAAGGLLKVQATQLAAGQSLHFNGAAEHDGSFLIFGGNGDDAFTGGDGNDGFYFGPGQFNAADTINGGPGGNDQLGLDGDYGSVGSPLVLGTNVTNVEVVVFLPGPAGTPNHFNVTTTDAFVGAGQTETIFALQTSTGFTFDGSNEHDGAFKVYGGSGGDTITGSAGGDWIFGGNGADTLTGGAGNDIFYYDNMSQSTLAASDTITDFATGDKIDLSAIDAVPGGGDDGFTFIGAGAFTHQAGQLQAINTGGNNWTISADLDGDGNADFQLFVTVSDAHALTATDFTP